MGTEMLKCTCDKYNPVLFCCNPFMIKTWLQMPQSLIRACGYILVA